MTLNSIIRNTCKKYPKKEAIIDIDNNIIINYESLLNKINVLSNILINNKINKETHVAVYLKNSYLQIISFFSILNIGAVPVLIDYQFTEREINECLTSSDTKIIICKSEEIKNNVINNIHNGNKNLTIIQFTNENKVNNNYNDYIYINIEKINNKYSQHNMYELKESTLDNYIILFTYRGLGYALPVILTENAIINSIKSNNILTEIDDTLRISLFLPASHIFSLTCNILSPLSVGGLILITNNLKPSFLLPLLEEYRINFIIMVPTLVIVLLHSIKKSNYQFNHLKKGIVGGNKFNNELFNEWKELTGSILLQGYGLTETCPVFCNQWENNKPESIGKLMLGSDAEIINKKGNIAEINKTGRLFIKTHSMMKGYYNQQLLTNKLLKESWFDTGDEAYMDENNFCHFVKRDKKIAKIGGSTVDIKEVENIIKTYPSMHEVKIKIEEDKIWQEKLICYIKSDKTIDKISLLQFCKTKLSPAKIPKEIKNI